MTPVEFDILCIVEVVIGTEYLSNEVLNLFLVSCPISQTQIFALIMLVETLFK